MTLEVRVGVGRGGRGGVHEAGTRRRRQWRLMMMRRWWKKRG